MFGGLCRLSSLFATLFAHVNLGKPAGQSGESCPVDRDWHSEERSGLLHKLGRHFGPESLSHATSQSQQELQWAETQAL